ncbi:hypothetical protein QO021_29915 (plasmid) [Pseudomonas amygdali pv. lachrymans]|uniref:hypothetical protein n=1 Tax=Pseudomonas amygdali TaxID=47877 RepID=UPI0006B9C36D|nr:hypothetical protein [Pseudomonas amygdali]KPC02089.1 Uncharacterized protein AC501_3375 [Pseudomonas amygdali pv. lachrymans]RMM39153.1 hypothetical protein ALQ79_200301 [Pseudomonas amygdali pv. lachrymans]WIO61305.1 hypothetical protein QO021_29915 [Pseudomonas amygdali pv. lachrymans]
MTRIPFQKTDIQEFKGLAKRMFRGLDLIDHKNPDRMRELVAKVFGYNDFHEVKKCADDVISPPVASITRFDIRLVAADGLMKVANISFVEAWLRAGRARLYGLSIDQFTVEALRAARLKARGVVESSHQVLDSSVTLPKWHDEQQRFFRNGAPSFELCVKHRVAAFHWGTFTAVYDAILSSRFKEAIINPDGLFVAGSDDAVDSYLRETLIPQCWLPLSQLIQDGLVVPDHEAVWLYVETGVCIGRGIRHKAHGAFLPRLFLTDLEVAEGLAMTLTGAVVQGGSSLGNVVAGVPKGNDLVYELKPGIRKPGAVTDPLKQPAANPFELDLVPNLFAGSQDILHGGGRGTTTNWGLDGKAIRISHIDRHSLKNTYFEVEPWLVESDFPDLFPDYVAPPAVNHRARFAWSKDLENKVFLPPVSLELQARAESIIERKNQKAVSQLGSAAGSGELFAKVEAAIPAVLLEQLASDLIYELFDGSYQADQIKCVSQKLVSWFPELVGFHPDVLYAVVAVHAQGVFGDHLPATLRLVDILSALVLLYAGFQAGGQFRFFRTVPSQIALGQWYNGAASLTSIHEVAVQYEGYVASLKDQQARISRITSSIELDGLRRAEAHDHKYLYVSDEMPRAKPVSLMQVVDAMGD